MKKLGGLKINKLKKELYKSIYKYGLTHSKTVCLSQTLDTFVVKKQLGGEKNGS
ncbi:aspartyl-phosphate phosphatase Spo0E family protein [Clostridium culturomicum]|uniref:aspartyl-phosphate phosphatase Spo0E family protein n=1 Tax=Hathewaya massiliensis TaxID=1964382 RepID=UPI00115AF6F5